MGATTHSHQTPFFPVFFPLFFSSSSSVSSVSLQAVFFYFGVVSVSTFCFAYPHFIIYSPHTRAQLTIMEDIDALILGAVNVVLVLSFPCAHTHTLSRLFGCGGFISDGWYDVWLCCCTVSLE